MRVLHPPYVVPAPRIGGSHDRRVRATSEVPTSFAPAWGTTGSPQPPAASDLHRSPLRDAVVTLLLTALLVVTLVFAATRLLGETAYSDLPPQPVQPSTAPGPLP